MLSQDKDTQATSPLPQNEKGSRGPPHLITVFLEVHERIWKNNNYSFFSAIFRLSLCGQEPLSLPFQFSFCLSFRSSPNSRTINLYKDDLDNLI